MRYILFALLLALPVVSATQPDMLVIRGEAHAGGEITVDNIRYGEATPYREPPFYEPFTFRTFTEDNTLIREADLILSFLTKDGEQLDSMMYQMRIPAQNVHYFTVHYNNSIIAKHSIADFACTQRCIGCEMLDIDCETMSVVQQEPKPTDSIPPPPQEPFSVPTIPLIIFAALLLIIIIGMVRKK